MRWVEKNDVELVLGIGSSLLLINLFVYGYVEIYLVSIPLTVVGALMLYKWQYRSSAASASFFYDDGDDDDLYEEAKSAVIEAGQASTSYLQRKLRVGYSRAARLMDMLEDNGVIGQAIGSAPRKVIAQTAT